MQSHPGSIVNVVSIDVEDWFQVENFASSIPRETWDSYPLRVERNVDRVLEIFDQTGVRGTFFTLGWIAERLPQVVRRIAAAGHELASHGWSHSVVWKLTPAEFRSEVSRSKSLLEDLSGQPVIGYRAPTFSVIPKTIWALDILGEEGYRYDSSIFPIWHDHYGIPDAPLNVYRHANGLWEIPMSVLDFGRMRLPVAGGGYFRLYPRTATSLAIGRLNRAGRAAVIYLHPWEFDPEQPKPTGVGAVTLLRHRIGLRSTGRRLSWLLKNFPFGPARDVLVRAGAAF
jgi:polysaccharide deacetylase family protein (PEP-CTERM system associated)